MDDKVFDAFRVCIIENKCFSMDCPYENRCDIANSKDQLIQIPKHLAMDVLNRLKVQEPIEPGREGEDMSEEFSSWWYVCKACGGAIDYQDDCCRHCGRPQNWDNEPK